MNTMLFIMQIHGMIRVSMQYHLCHILYLVLVIDRDLGLGLGLGRDRLFGGISVSAEIANFSAENREKIIG